MDAGETATDNLGNLLDTALELAIDAHLVQVRALLGRGDEAIAADTFFDLQIADLAMGSAHFLVAAIDRMEAKFTAFLTEKQIPAVSDELTRLLRQPKPRSASTPLTWRSKPPIDPDDIHLICWTVILPAWPVTVQEH